MQQPRWLAISSAGSALCFSLREGSSPAITHWGRRPDSDLEAFADALAETEGGGVGHASPDAPRRVPIVPQRFDDWAGSPGLEAIRNSRGAFPRLVLDRVEHREATGVSFLLTDAANAIRLEIAYDFDAHGVLRVAGQLTNTGTDPLDVIALRMLLPLPPRADELLDLTGRWGGERQPQRSALTDGARRRAAHRGRPGHDSPILSIAGTPGFGFRSGEVWGAHLAWSGNGEYLVERLNEGVGVLSTLIGVGENLSPGEVTLAPGESYRGPDAVFVWSDAGIDGLSARLHASVRAHAAHPSRPRPLTLNTWEAVYFRQEPAALAHLAEVAAGIGVERFVLDDGWFEGRRTATAGLGDWSVDRSVWLDGLGPLADRVRELGMEFGLWVEPEMVNLDSGLAREHPEWLLAPPEGVGGSWRSQYVLNIAHPDAYSHLLDRIDSLIADLGIAYLKWDHNREVMEGVDRRTGAPGAHAQTRALYAMLDELHRRHPGLEIESCASGGARIDLGILERTQRVWPSDSNDPVARHEIQRWTGVLIPPELVGSHVGPKRAHTTGRETDLAFRLITALFGHAGIEWDITGCTEQQLDTLRTWAAYSRDHRALIATGTTVRADGLPDGTLLHGLVSPDRATALYAWVQLTGAAQGGARRVPLPGLDAARRYRLDLAEPFGRAARQALKDPSWIAEATAGVFSGELLGAAGLPLPLLGPAQAVLLEVVAV